MGQIIMTPQDITAIPAPDAGYVVLAVDLDGILKSKDESNVVATVQGEQGIQGDPGPTNYYKHSQTITSAELLTIGTNPVQLLPSPGAGKYYIIISSFLSRPAGTVYSSGNSNFVTRYISSQKIATQISIGSIQDSSSASVWKNAPADNVTKETGIELGVDQNVNPTGGDFDIKFNLLYTIEDI